MKLENKKTWTGIFILIAVEQFIKIVINSRFLDKRFPILPPLLYFEPVFNRRYSWYNSMLQLGDGKTIHIIIVAVMITLMYLFYSYLNKELGKSRIINVMFAFIFSGAVCSLIDKVFWNGSLDYILVNRFFTFDLKDVYINIFIGLLIISVISDNKVLKQIDEKDIFKSFVKYILRKS